MRRIVGAELEELHRDFEASLRRTVAERVALGWVKTHKPVLDDGPGFRAWDTMEDYRRWCESELPEFLGYRRVAEADWDALIGADGAGGGTGRR